MPIYTLEYITREAEAIAGHWNGSDERFMDGNGDNRTDEEAMIAGEIIEMVQELKTKIIQLSI